MRGLILSSVWDIECPLASSAFKLWSVPCYRLLHTILEVDGWFPAQLSACFGIVSYAALNVDASSVWVPVDLCLDAADLHCGLDYFLDGPLDSAAKVVDLGRSALLC